MFATKYHDAIIFGIGCAAGGISMAIVFMLRRNAKESMKWVKHWKVGDCQRHPYRPAVFRTISTSSASSSVNYNLMINSIVPRPIALISSIDKNGIVNCSPFSYFGGVAHDPPLVIIGICMNMKSGTKKDTLKNIEQTGEFVINIISEWYAQSANHTSGSFPPEIDEMDIAGLTKLPSIVVKPPRVGEAAISMECEVYKLEEIINDSGQHSTTIVIGQVQRFHVLEDVLSAESFSAEYVAAGKIAVDPHKLRPLGRLGGDTYTTLGATFDLARPKV